MTNATSLPSNIVRVPGIDRHLKGKNRQDYAVQQSVTGATETQESVNGVKEVSRKMIFFFLSRKDTVPSREEDFMADHFCQYAAHRPYVH